MFEFGASHKHVGHSSGGSDGQLLSFYTPKLSLDSAVTKSLSGRPTAMAAPCSGLRLNFRVADNLRVIMNRLRDFRLWADPLPKHGCTQRAISPAVLGHGSRDSAPEAACGRSISP